MNALVLFFAIGVAFALYTVLDPILGRRRRLQTEVPDEIRELYAQEAALRKQLEDLEVDLASGKLSEEDFQRLTQGLRAELVQVQKRLRQFRQERSR